MRMLLALFVVFSASPALADLAPRPDYVETCTIENHQKDGLTCTSCTADYAHRDKCELELGPKGYKKACNTRGASVWNEVWCLAPAPAPEKPAEPEEKATEKSQELVVKAADVQPKRDSKCGAGGLGVGLPLLLALGLLRMIPRRVGFASLRIRRHS